MEIRDILKNLREKRGLTQEQLAERRKACDSYLSSLKHWQA